MKSEICEDVKKSSAMAGDFHSITSLSDYHKEINSEPCEQIERIRYLFTEWQHPTVDQSVHKHKYKSKSPTSKRAKNIKVRVRA